MYLAVFSFEPNGKLCTVSHGVGHLENESPLAQRFDLCAEIVNAFIHENSLFTRQDCMRACACTYLIGWKRISLGTLRVPMSNLYQWIKKSKTDHMSPFWFEQLGQLGHFARSRLCYVRFAIVWVPTDCKYCIPQSCAGGVLRSVRMHVFLYYSNGAVITGSFHCIKVIHLRFSLCAC